MVKKDKKIIGLIHAILDVEVNDRTKEQKKFLKELKVNTSLDKLLSKSVYSTNLYANLDLAKYYIRLELDKEDWNLDDDGNPKEESIPTVDVERVKVKLISVKVTNQKKEKETSNIYEAVKIRMIKLDDEWEDESNNENIIKSIRLDDEWKDDASENTAQSQNA